MKWVTKLIKLYNKARNKQLIQRFDTCTKKYYSLYGNSKLEVSKRIFSSQFGFQYGDKSSATLFDLFLL